MQSSMQSSSAGATLDVQQMTQHEAEETATDMLAQMTEQLIVGDGSFELQQVLKGTKQEAMTALQQELDKLEQ